MPIAAYEGQTFTNKAFNLEECWFVNCVLKECVIFYSGGSYRYGKHSFWELPMEIPRSSPTHDNVTDPDWIDKGPTDTPQSTQ
jgi:hypothetical protein